MYTDILIFFYLVNLETRLNEILGQISDPKNLGRGSEDQSTNPDSKPRQHIKILGREFQMCGWIFEIQISDRMQ